MTTFLAKSCHDKMTTYGCQECDKVVVGDLLDHFSLITNFLRESYQDKTTTQRLSRYLKVVTGSSSGSSSVERLS